MESGADRVAAYFDARAPDYDAEVRRGLPRYDELLETLVRSLPAQARTALELGCGTGALTVRVLARFPGLALRAVDASSAMLALTRERLGREDRSELERAQFETLRLEPGRYDLIVSSMALHHVRDKAPLYARLCRSLRPGGHLVFADELVGALPHVESLHWNAWLEFARRPGHLSLEELETTLRHVEELDHYETLPRQLELLRGTGFDLVDCVWRYLNYAIFTARRPTG